MSKIDQYVKSLSERLSEEKTSEQINELLKEQDFWDDFKSLAKSYGYSIKKASKIIKDSLL